MQQLRGITRYHFPDERSFYSGLFGVPNHRGPPSPELQVIQFLGTDNSRGYDTGYHKGRLAKDGMSLESENNLSSLLKDLSICLTNPFKHRDSL